MPEPLTVVEEIVKNERAALVAIARGEGLSSEDALDVVQDALCTYLDAAGEAVERPAARVATIVRNAARNQRRRHHRARPHEPIGPGEEPSADAPDTEALLAAGEDVVRLRLCVRELCEIQRAVVLLRLLEERSGEDVARELGLRRGYVDVLVHRARASLRECVTRPAAG